MPAKTAPIIVIKKKVSNGGHHGGAWKVAYADFVTALMALFIVLWLLSQSNQVKRAVAGYFNDPKGTGKLLGTTMSGTGAAVTPEDANRQLLEQFKEKFEKEIQSNKELEKLVKQIEITITSEGLRIEMIEDKNGTFYQSGSAQLSANGQALLGLLASELKTMPNQLLIEGHTDAAPYSNDATYTNWELSADRANAARRLLQQNGVRKDQVTQVRGYADQFLRVKNNPYDPSNRRITILVKNSSAGSPLSPPAHARVVDDQPSTQLPPAPAAPAHQNAAPAATKPVSAVNSPQKSSFLGKVTKLLPGRKQ